MVILGRALEPAAFGVFALAFAVLILAERLQHGLIGTPLLAIPSDSEEGRSGSAGLVWWIQWRLVAVVAALVAVSGLLLASVVDWPGVRGATLSLIPTLVGTQARDLSRYVCYRHGRPYQAALIGGLSGVLQLATLSSLLLTDSLNVGLGIAVLGGSAASSFVLTLPLMLPLLRRSEASHSLKRALWERGRWLGLSNLVFWGATQLFLFAAAGMLGPAQAGVFRAAQSVLGPTQFLVAGLFNGLLPGAARELSTGSTVWASVRASVLTIGGAVGAYCALVALFPETMLTLLFGSQYGGYGFVVRTLAAGYLMSGLAGAMMLVLVVLHRTELVLRAHVATLFLGLMAAFPVVRQFGLTGAALGLSAVYACRFLTLAYYARTAAQADNQLGGGHSAEGGRTSA